MVSLFKPGTGVNHHNPHVCLLGKYRNLLLLREVDAHDRLRLWPLSV